MTSRVTPLLYSRVLSAQRQTFEIQMVLYESLTLGYVIVVVVFVLQPEDSFYL